MIDWTGFLVVFAAALIAACVVVSLYSFGIRFLATPAKNSLASGPSRDDEDDDVDAADRPMWATMLAYICFGLSGACVLFGIYLIIPIFHA